MLKRCSILFLILLFAIASFSVCAAPKQIVIKAAHSMPTTYHYHDGMVRFAQVVEKLSKGSMKVEIYPAGQLGEERVTMEQLKMGAIPIVLTGISDVYAPRTGVFILPFLFKDSAHTDRVLNGPIGQEVYGDLLKHNMKMLSVWENGFRQISNNRRPINSVEDLKGLKIRVPESPVWLSTMKAFNANPIPMPFAETATALAQGLVDGQENALLHMLANKTYEVQKYIAVVNYMYGPAPLLANVQWFNSLTKRQQKILLKAADEGNKHMRAVCRQREKDAIALFKKAGIGITYPDLKGFREKAKQVHEEFADKFGAKLIKKIINY
jgi:tripartite ATP-independent transporter DctP family solute receptor